MSLTRTRKEILGKPSWFGAGLPEHLVFYRRLSFPPISHPGALNHKQWDGFVWHWAYYFLIDLDNSEFSRKKNGKENCLSVTLGLQILINKSLLYALSMSSVMSWGPWTSHGKGPATHCSNWLNVVSVVHWFPGGWGWGWVLNKEQMSLDFILP